MGPLISGELPSGDGSSGGDELLQTAFWGAFKEAFGWKARRFSLEGGSLLVLLRPFAPGFALGYIPHGPDIPPGADPGDYLAQMGRELKAFLPKNCLFLRFDLPQETTEELKESLEKNRPLEKAPVDIQPPDTVIIPLEPTEEDLLASMKHKTRYNIRLAEKKGVRVVEAHEEDLKDWHRLYEETLRRDRIAGHSPKYFESLFSLSRSYGEGVPVLRLLFAEAEGERVAAVIIGRCCRRSTYLYGASSNRHRNLMPAYALQWHAVKTEKAAGSLSYDLFGIPPAEDEGHPMHGLYRFKTGFGGRIVHRPGCWDFPLRPGLYRLYRWAEKMRNYYFKVLKKRLSLL